MFKAIIVIVLIVVTVTMCTEEEKKTVVKNTKETGSFLINMKNAFVKGLEEMDAKSRKILQEGTDARNKQVRDNDLRAMKAFKKYNAEADAILKEQIKNHVRQ